MAKLFMCHAYRDVTATCEQVWGGVGFTIEYDIQLFFRRAKQLQLSWWDERQLTELIASAYDVYIAIPLRIESMLGGGRRPEKIAAGPRHSEGVA